MNKVISPFSAKHQEIFEYLKKELQLPEHTKVFSLIMELDEPVTVSVTYYPKDLSND